VAGEAAAAVVVAPAEKLDGGVARAHRTRELDRVLDGLVAGEAAVTVGGLVADLPETDVVGFVHPVTAALRIVRIVRVGYPIRCLVRVASAVLAVNRIPVLLVSVAEEVDAH